MDFYLPYLLDYSHLAVEEVTIFLVAALASIMVSAEGQAFVAALLGDTRPGPKDRFHYNVFLHMSVLGTLNFLVAGFGWAKEMDIDVTRFKAHAKLYLVISRLAGPAANLLLANIAASLNWIIGTYGYEDKVFAAIAVVNVTMAVYSLMPLVPLPGAAVLLVLFPGNDFFIKVRKYLSMIGPYLIIAIFGLARLSGWDGISAVFTPIVMAISKTILGG